MTPLAKANAGDTVIIRKVTGEDSTRRHLAEMGLVVGEQVSVVSTLNGDMILSVKDSRVALDVTMTERIMI